MAIKHEMADQPLFDVVPCVGFKVEKITPDEKYYDFDKEGRHYSMNSDNLLNDFPALGTYRTLETNPAFKQAKKIVNMKNMYTTKQQYNQLCANIAQSMGLQEKGLSPEQLLEQQIQNTLNNGKFNNNPNQPAVSSRYDHYHKLSQEEKQNYSDGSRLSSIKRDMF